MSVQGQARQYSATITCSCPTASTSVVYVLLATLQLLRSALDVDLKGLSSVVSLWLFAVLLISCVGGPSSLLMLVHASSLLCSRAAESWLMLRQELVRTVASRQMQLVGLPHNIQRVRRVSREVFNPCCMHDCKWLPRSICCEDVSCHQGHVWP